ncbi:hypothetical protein VPHD63_0038 [Vibrio phage D63]
MLFLRSSIYGEYKVKFKNLQIYTLHLNQGHLVYLMSTGKPTDRTLILTRNGDIPCQVFLNASKRRLIR